MRGRRSSDALGVLIILGVVAASLVGLAWVGIPTCPSRVLFGVPCPGCGLTRATLALARGDVSASIRFHPLASVVLALAGYGIGASLWNRVRSSVVPTPPAAVYVGLGVALLALWCVRVGGGLGGLPDPIAPSQGLLTAPAFER